MNKSTIITAVVSTVLGGVAGGAKTYLTVNKALRTRYEDWANAEIESVKHRYSLLRKEDGTVTTILQAAEDPSDEVKAEVEQSKQLMHEMGYTNEEIEEATHPSAQTLSIFDRAVDPSEFESSEEDDEDDDDYDQIDGEPYLITEEAYFENEPEYELDTLTYYELDHTLTDDKNVQIDRVEETIGERHLHMFKKNGTQKTSLYIRNDDHQTLYEVILVEQSYAVAILGMEEEEVGLREPKKKLKKMPKDVD